MLNNEQNNRSDALETILQGVGDQMLPPPELEKAVIAGVPYRGGIAAGIHVRKFVGAIVAYAVGIMLFLGAIMLWPRLFNTQSPVGTNFTTTPDEIQTSFPDNTDYVNDHHCTTPSVTTAPDPEHVHEYTSLTTDGNPCTEEIVTTYICKHCEHSYTETTSATGHDYQNGVCSRCGEKEPDQPVVDGSQGLEYALNGDSYTVEGIGTCTDTEIVIPAAYQGKPVTAIGDYAFSWCTELTAVTIPNSVKSIGSQAFIYCESLTSIVIPDGVLTIEDHAFSDCYSLTSVTMSDSVTSIGWSAFSYCLKLQSVRLSESLTVLEEDLFSSCQKLTSVQIPNSVTVIGMGAFSGTPLASIDIPSGVTKIDEAAFFGCRFTTILIPAKVTYIGSRAFYGCDQLTSITFDGTEAEWNAIEKGEDWDSKMPSYKVHFNAIETEPDAIDLRN